MKDFSDTRPVGLYDEAIGSKNRDYYLDKFEDFDQREAGWHVSWNWAAFFFTGFWALYRKMYGLFFAWWAVGTVLAVFSKVQNSEISQTLGIMTGILLFAFSLYANTLYHRKIKKRIASAQRSHSDASRVSRRLSVGGGVHGWMPIVFGAIPVIGIVAAVALPAYQDYTKRQTVAASSVPNIQASADLAQAKDCFWCGEKPAPQLDLSEFQKAPISKPEAESPNLDSDKKILKEQGVGGNQNLSDVSAWGDAQMAARFMNAPDLQKAHNFAWMWQRQIIHKLRLSPERALFLGYSIVASQYDGSKMICRPDISKHGGIEDMPGDEMKVYPECFV